MSSAISFLSKIKAKKFLKTIRPLIIFISLIIIFILGPYLFYNINYMGRIYPNIYISGVDVGGMTPEEATSQVAGQVEVLNKINLVSRSKSFDLFANDIDLNYNYSASVERAYNLARTGNFFYDTVKRLQLLTHKSSLGLSINLDESKLLTIVENIDKEISVKPVYPSIQTVNGNILIDKGTPGTTIDSINLRILIGSDFALGLTKDLVIPINKIDPTLSAVEVATAEKRSQAYLGKSLTLKFEFTTYVYKDSDLLKFINPAGGYNEQLINETVFQITSDINRDPENPKFEFNGTKVTEFQPALDGISLDNQKFKDLLTSSLDLLAISQNKTASFDIPVITTKPQVATEQVNNLGIKELIGRGDSTYFHSIPGRVFNVNLAASRINGTLVAPGETFSFNQTLGDVSKFTGYQQAYIISGGKTILGDGGGVCQVSTTLFRAVMNTGLPISERSAHAYRVGYYEQNSPPGLDATVYAPSPDFKFVNDTGNYVLIEAINDSKNYSLVFELYGTSDGRVATISKPVVSNYSPPLATVYQDDPTLPLGTLKQTDFSAAGAKVTFNYSVARAGQQIYQKIFVSNYQPWAAVYLKGTKI